MAETEFIERMLSMSLMLIIDKNRKSSILGNILYPPVNTRGRAILP